ncbi:MAG: hypothetical protein HY702_05405 [Gemmatimonadetes bacterium]|nr:hypothetical protein [Gemmatimonadota bacterium]
MRHTPALRRWGALVLALAVLAPELRAQEVQKQGFLAGKRKWMFAVIAAVAVGVPAYIAGGSRTVEGNCSDRGCLTTIAVLVGGGAGFLIGLEQDQRLKRRLRTGPTLRYQSITIPLTLVPDRLTPFSGGAVVTGIGGAEVVYSDGRVVGRARGVRGIEDAAVLEERDLIVLATGSGLLAFPLSGDTVGGVLLDRSGGSAVEEIESNLAVADASEIRLVRIAGADDALSTEPLAAVASDGAVADLGWNPFRRTAWVLVGNRLASYAPAGLEKLGEVALPGEGISLRIRADRAVVAVGTAGVALVDIADPATPRLARLITGLRFAYSADLDGDRLYVAAGPEGLMVIDISDESAPKVLGVARTPRFVRDVMVVDGRVWVLDRDRRRVEVAEFAAPATPGQ